jgi:DNA-binding transcriptional LysR family regulator
MMDLNLLVVLDVLLEEESVSRAAERLNMSVPAVSRALGRLRAALGDPLLVRSGRGLRPTAAAVDLKPRVRALIDQARALAGADTASGIRTFTIMAPADVIATAGAGLLDRIAADEPGTRLRLMSTDHAADEAEAVRDGIADAAISVNAAKHADLHSLGLVRAPLTAVVRTGHDLATGAVTPERFSAWPHVMTSRHGRLRSATDTALAGRGHPRAVTCSVPDFGTALQLASTSDLVAIAPASLVTRLHTVLGLIAINAPLTLRPLRVSLLWHPRQNRDPAHQRLRSHITALAANPASEVLQTFRTGIQ